MVLPRKDKMCAACGARFWTKAELSVHLHRAHALAPLMWSSPRPAGAAGAQELPTPVSPLFARAGQDPPPLTLHEGAWVRCDVCGQEFGSNELYAEHVHGAHPGPLATAQH